MLSHLPGAMNQYYVYSVNKMRTRNFKKTRKPHKMIFVVCEGDTEQAYVEMLKRYYRLPITVKTKVSGNRINSKLLNQYIAELGLDKEYECIVFLMYDGDVKAVVDRLNSLKGTLILSTPCIEYWFLIHSLNHVGYIESKEVVRKLIASNSVWAGYTKGRLTENQVTHLVKNRIIACERGRKLMWPYNPSSNLHMFIDTLEREKNS